MAIIKARLQNVMYIPRIFPVEESLENIFKSSSKEKMIKVFRDKYKTNMMPAFKAFFTKVKLKRAKMLIKDTKSKNLYPPIFLNILGTNKSAKIDPIDPKI